MHSDLQNLKVALKQYKTLSANWQCGDLQKLVNFDGWGEGFRMPDHPYHKPLTLLHDHLSEFVELEDFGNGEVCLGKESDEVVMTFSNLAVWEKQESDDGSCPRLIDAELKIPDLHANDFEVEMFFLDDRSSEDWITDFDCDLEFEDDSFDTLKRALQPSIDPYLNYEWYGFCEPALDKYYLSNVAFNGEWRSEDKTFTYSISPSFAFVAKKLEKETVTLFA